MTSLRVRDLLRVDGAEGRGVDAVLDADVVRVCTDSRLLEAGDVFVALKGERFDAHAFVPEAIARGAMLAVVRRAWVRRNGRAVAGLPLVVVDDTLVAYGQMARIHREHFPIPMLLITGSNGKTSTKELVAAVLATKYRVLRTEGNFNNLVGLPATLLRLDATHQVAVVEAGTNQPGDIPALCAIAQHTHAAITNIGRAHIERLLSREGIAEEKGVVYRTLPREGTAIVNADDPLVRRQVPRGRRRILFGHGKDADVRITSVTLDAEARTIVRLEAPAFSARAVTLRLRVYGEHSAMNAVLAFAAGCAFGCSVTKMKAALEAYEGVAGRMRVSRAAGVTVIDDTYNANPDSVRAAIAMLAGMQVEGRRIAVLGDMLELGRAAAEEHRGIGAALVEAGIPYVLTVGRHAREIARAARSASVHADHFADKTAVCAALDALVDDGDAVLVKGSRGARMEEVTQHLLARGRDAEEAG
jgi:UDP-N-acetylmuramoyl-tripeptide--D-alanyl-D-alanine ligase